MELNLDQDQLIQWNGQTRQVIGLLQPKSKKEINLSIVPLQKGTLQLPKLAFKDTLLGRFNVLLSYSCFFILIPDIKNINRLRI